MPTVKIVSMPIEGLDPVLTADVDLQGALTTAIEMDVPTGSAEDSHGADVSGTTPAGAVDPTRADDESAGLEGASGGSGAPTAGDRAYLGPAVETVTGAATAKPVEVMDVPRSGLVATSLGVSGQVDTTGVGDTGAAYRRSSGGVILLHGC